MVEQHDAPLRALLAAFPATVELEVDGLGDVLFCHGSPRSDEELVTVETPESRLADAIAGTTRRTSSSTAHTHVSYERHVLGRTFFNPGSVGMPYEGAPGAYWALLGAPARTIDADRAPADGVRPRRDGAPLSRRAAIRWRPR